MVKNLEHKDNPLASILEQNRQVGGSFSDIQFYHVLHEHNKEADRWENVGLNKKEGELMVNGVLTHQSISSSMHNTKTHLILVICHM
jgi:hypothetical protein